MKALFRSFALLSMLVLTTRSYAVFTADWNFMTGTGAPLALPANVTGGVVTEINAFTGNIPKFDMVNSSRGYSGSSGFFNASIAVQPGPLVVATSTYFEFTLGPVAGYALTATSFQVGSLSENTGPTTLKLLASTDGFTTSATVWTAPVVNDSNWALATGSFTTYSAAADVPITFRLYGTNGTGGSIVSDWRIDDMKLGITAAVPEPSTYATMFLGVLVLGARALRRRKSTVA